MEDEIFASLIQTEDCRFEPEALTVYMAVLDGNGAITLTSATWEQAGRETGNPLLTQAILGTNYLHLCEAASDVLRDETTVVRQGLQNVLNGTRKRFLHEYTCYASPEPHRLLLQIMPLSSGEGATVLHIDITQLRRMESHFANQAEHITELIQEMQSQNAHLEVMNANLEAMAATDGLTTLKNHRAFQEHMKVEFERARRYHAELSLVLLDVDHFKLYNDAFGHPAGDTVLVQVAKLLRAMARDTDFIARYGGEEFAMILPNTDQDGAVVLAQRIRAAMQAAPWKKRTVTASFGVASLTSATANPAEMIEQADEALYTSKQAGRNRVHHYADSCSLAPEQARNPHER